MKKKEKLEEEKREWRERGVQIVWKGYMSREKRKEGTAW